MGYVITRSEMMDAHISLIIPTFNRSSALRKVFPSYLRQKYVREILIVDDFGSDNLEEQIQEIADGDRRLRYIRLDRHVGLPGARNAGIVNAAGDYILFGEDDVYFTPDYAEKLLSCAYKTRADIIAGRIISLRHGYTKQESVAIADSYQGPLFNKRLLFGCFWKNTVNDVEVPFVHACALIKKDVLEKFFYDEGYGGNGWREETDLYLRAIRYGFKIYFCPHTVCYHLPRDFSRVGGCLNMNIFAYQYWALKNNYKFLKRYYPFLKKRLDITNGFLRLMLVQAQIRFKHCLIHFVEKYYMAEREPWMGVLD